MRLGRDRAPIREIVEKAAEMYNKYRAPEAIAEIVEVKADHIIVMLDGSFCRTCGINDWVEDFKYVLEDLGYEAELVEIIEPEDMNEEWRIGVFRILGTHEKRGQFHT